jgi:hypothetical protein
LQRIEKDVRNLSATVSVLAALDNAAAKKRIEETFGSDPKMVVIYRGVQAGLTQSQIAAALSARGLRGSQQRVSEALDDFEELGFIERSAKGPPVPLPGWEPFGLTRVLKKTLRRNDVPDLD